MDFDYTPSHPTRQPHEDDRHADCFQKHVFWNRYRLKSRAPGFVQEVQVQILLSVSCRAHIGIKFVLIHHMLSLSQIRHLRLPINLSEHKADNAAGAWSGSRASCCTRGHRGALRPARLGHRCTRCRLRWASSTRSAAAWPSGCARARTRTQKASAAAAVGAAVQSAQDRYDDGAHAVQFTSAVDLITDCISLRSAASSGHILLR